LDHALVTLASCAREEKTSSLWPTVVSSMQKCLEYDQDGGFLNEERLGRMVQPLVEQLGVTDGTREAYLGRMQSALGPCLGQLAVASRSDTILKQLNHQVLMKTRHEKAMVRDY
jgi:U3 small nucleolar RNA-associated protein 10